MLNIEALRIKDTVTEAIEEEKFTVDFESRKLPENSTKELPEHIRLYAESRALPVDKLMYSNSKAAGMHNRVIVPFKWKRKTIGFSARSVDDDTKPKYFTSHDSGFVYGIDNQLPDSRFVIVTEGLLDAMCIGGVGIMNNRCSETQAQLIDNLAREVILVPDKDKAGQRLIDDALEYGWAVSFPDWESDIKDVNDAVVRYGKLFTLKSIIDAKQTMSLKINLLRKRIG